MANDSNPYEEDLIFLRTEFSKWWKLPTIDQEEMFCERVAIMCENGAVDENEVRKIILDRMIYK